MPSVRNILIPSLLSLLLPFLACSQAHAQEQTLTFTSVSDAKFFVYLNGALQNEKSSGMVTLRGLEEKEYHIRIVIDDPFEVAVTRRIKPDKKHNEYSVLFNAVRERVYLKPVKADGEEQLWQPDTTTTRVTQPSEETQQKPRKPLNRNSQDNQSERPVNTLHDMILDE